MTAEPLHSSSSTITPEVDAEPFAPVGIGLLAPERWAAISPLGEGNVEVAGKLLSLAGQPFFLRGVTYGPFAPEPDGTEYHTPESVESDFARIAAHGFNALRTYTPPPPWLLDIAHGHGLRVLIGLPWEQHVTFLDSRARRRAIVAGVRRSVAGCSRHPAVLGYAVGNEIPQSIVRWYGPRAIESFVRRLYEEAKSEHPEALVTYVNFPTTEYLDLPFLDFFAWNLYLEAPENLARYLARLQNLAGEKPLVLAEIGLDSLRNGEREQAAVLDWQIRTAGAAGCAGAVLFSWTDEWHRAGHEVLDWSFGLTDRSRRPKRALEKAAAAFAEFPLPDQRLDWPLISVVVCSYNGARTLRETLEALGRLDYPWYEVIVIDDGSTDGTADIAAASLEALSPRIPVRLRSIANHGLSYARNLGLREAGGEIVAYLDDDAYPDPLWLRYLAHSFMTTDHAGVGGPNVCPPSDGEVAHCVSHSPGGPNHVLLSDTVAEHIPGCNMAFRREALLEVGGFDEQFRIAGDDVDLCWRLQEQGHTLGFHPTAMVWHHCRSTIKDYLRQQSNYGRAEAMLEEKWPSKYNSAGYPRWEGRVYGRGQREPLGYRRGRIYHGVWGTNLFQTLYVQPPGRLRSLTLLPEWYLLIGLLAVVSLAGAAWKPLWWALPALLAAVGVLVSQAVTAARRAPLPWTPRVGLRRRRERATIALLHLLQPLMRLRGRLSHGLHPLRRRKTDGDRGFVLPRPRCHAEWSEEASSAEEQLGDLERRLQALGARVRRGGNFDPWDLEIRGGLFGSLRLVMAIEEHGHGKQMVRVKSWPTLAPMARQVLGGLMALGGLFLVFDHRLTATALITAGALLGSRAFFDCSAAASALLAERRASLHPGATRK